MKLEDVSRLRSEDCSFQTFSGERVTAQNLEDDRLLSDDQKQFKGYYIDQIKYSKTALTGTSLSVEIPADNGRKYFKTEIQNNSKLYSSVVSLYIDSITPDLIVSCTSPSNTVRKVSGSSEIHDYYIVRNAYVKIKDDNDVDGSGILTVEWYIENTTDSDITVDLSGLYLMYN
ncbi:MAG: hypothetical protein IJI50_09205 [Ruminococcus sp.]|nr:hypothetical protein [Ruminococcus sp.]